MKKTLPWTLAVALGATVTSVPLFAQQATVENAQRAQQEEKKDDQKKEDHRANKQEQQAARAERQQEKRERHQLNDMPKPVREVLKRETADASDIDYFRQKDTKPPQFGATFTAANGHKMEIHVDREGTVLSRNDMSATASAAQPGAAAPVQPAPAQPAPGQPAPAPAPSAPSARADAPESGNAIYRRLQPNEVPQNIRTVLDREAAGGSDIKYYRTKYGNQLAYEVKFDDKNGVGRGIYADDSGAIVARHEDRDDHDAQAAASSNNKSSSSSNKSSSTSNKSSSGGNAQANYSRVELDTMPRAVQTQFRRLTEGGKDVKFYRTKYGSDQAYEAKFTGRDGKDRAIYVDDSGKVLSDKTEGSEKASSSSASKK